MKILLVNDDGYKAEGINVLERVLREYGHEIYLNAPSSQMSGKSHSMTFHVPLKVHRLAPNRFATDGTPVDCVLYSKRLGLFNPEPDLVISGINEGYNVACDIIYSGTCGGAREGALSGMKSIAISCEGKNYEEAARFLCDRLDDIYPLLDDTCFLNLNFPPNFNGEMKFTIPGDVRYCDDIEITDDDGETMTMLVGDVHKIDGHREGMLNDIEACSEGYASASVISIYSFIDEDRQKALEEVLN